MEALTLTVMANGVLQHSPPRLEMLSQLPPSAVYTAELKVKFVPVLATCQDLRQRIRAALGHGEIDRIHLREDIGSHGDADRDGHFVTCGLQHDLAVKGPGRQSAGGQGAGRDRHADRGRRGAT